MPTFTERDALKVIDATVDPEGDPLSVIEINGSAGLVGVPVALSIGGTITVAADGTAIFDDTGFTWPAPGNAVADSLIATVSDGINPLAVAVDLQIHTPA